MKKASQVFLTASAFVAAALSGGEAIAGGAFAYEVGTEDLGLASAGYAARAQDATTVFTNPAGMTRLDGQQLQLGTQLLYSNLKFSSGSGTSAALGTENGGYAAGSSGWFPGGGLFYSYSVSPDLKLGFASTGNFGAALKYNDNWVGRYYVQQAALVGASLLPSIAYRLNENFSVGMSVNAMYGYLKNVTAVNNDFGLADGKVTLRDTTWGWGVNLGLLYEPTPTTRLGLTYNSQVKLDFSAPAQFSGTGPILTAALRVAGLQNATVNLGIKVPQQVMGSVFHTVNDRWSLLANVGWQQWSKFGQAEIGVDSRITPTSLTTNIPFKDTWHGAVGAQYRVSEPWRLNIGVAYDSAFQSGPTISPLLPVNAAWRFGVGAQNQASKSFSWGVAGEYLSGGTLDVNKQSVLPVALGGRGNVVGSYSNVGTYYMSANFNWKY